MLNRIRRKLDDAVRVRVDQRVDALVDQRMARTLEDVTRAQADYEARLGGNQADFSYLRSEFDRIAPQLAALEQRLEWLRARLELEELDPEDAVVRARAEHERARIRLELAAHYEERLRRLESEGA